ncbi:MAG: hypothetical protein KDD54_01240 [Flavobacteriales bacterium]|nr:hypothetical protein [Flavobacteriales bacterium]
MIKTGRISPGPALAAGSFLILYVGLAWFNRLSRDDFALLELVKSRGILHATWLFYSDWNGRWIALLQSHTWLAFYNRYTLLLFAISHLAIAWWAVRRILVSLRLSIPHHNWLALIFINGWFLTTQGVGESWWWVSTSTSYMSSLVALLVLTSCLLRKNSGTRNLVLPLLCALYIGASNETLALLSIAAMVALAWKKPDLRRQLIPALIVMGGAFATLLVAPGNMRRSEHLSPFSLDKGVRMWLISGGRFFLKTIPLHVLWTILAALPFYGYLPQISTKQLKRVAGVWLILALVIPAPSVLITSDVAPDRVMAPMGLLTQVFTIVAVMWLKGQWPVVGQKAAVMSSWLLLCGNILWMVVQFPVASTYANAVDARMQNLHNIRKAPGEVVTLAPLPPSGWLLSAEVSVDKNDDLNRQLKEALHLPFDVRVESLQD